MNLNLNKGSSEVNQQAGRSAQGCENWVYWLCIILSTIRKLKTFLDPRDREIYLNGIYLAMNLTKSLHFTIHGIHVLLFSVLETPLHGVLFKFKVSLYFMGFWSMYQQPLVN